MRKLTLKELNRVSPAEFKAQDKTSIVLILDNVRSALNVGSAFRTADAFALERIYLCGITAQPPHREILKTAIGATDSVSWKYTKTTSEAIHELRDSGYQIIAIEQADESISLEEFPVSKGEKYAFIYGNEVTGVEEAAMKLIDHCIEVPQYGTKHSLNISVCLGIVTWEIFRQIKF